MMIVNDDLDVAGSAEIKRAEARIGKKARFNIELHFIDELRGKSVALGTVRQCGEHEILGQLQQIRAGLIELDLGGIVRAVRDEIRVQIERSSVGRDIDLHSGYVAGLPLTDHPLGPDCRLVHARYAILPAHNALRKTGRGVKGKQSNKQATPGNLRQAAFSGRYYRATKPLAHTLVLLTSGETIRQPAISVLKTPFNYKRNSRRKRATCDTLQHLGLPADGF